MAGVKPAGPDPMIRSLLSSGPPLPSSDLDCGSAAGSGPNEMGPAANAIGAAGANEIGPSDTPGEGRGRLVGSSVIASVYQFRILPGGIMKSVSGAPEHARHGPRPAHNPRIRGSTAVPISSSWLT